MSSNTSGFSAVGGLAQAYAEEGISMAAIGVCWKLLLLGIILNALLCHISPGLMVRLQSNPWTTQFNWLFGVKAQNFQTLNFVLYHQSFMGKASHIPTIAAEFFAWSFVVYWGLGSLSCFLMLVLVLVQAASSRFVPLIVATGIAALSALAASVYADEQLAPAEQLFIYRCMQVVILIGGPMRVCGHYFEEKLPPMPRGDRRESTLFRFKTSREIHIDLTFVLTVAPQAVLAEASAGMPLRLFVPMLNIFIGQYFETADDTRPEGLESVQALNKTTDDILKKGWSMSRPSTANLIRNAARLETAPNVLPDAFLAPKWYWFFVIECLALLIMAIVWLLAPNTLMTRYGWVPYSSDVYCCGLAPDGDAVTPTAFALAIAASVVLCGFVWVMLRMLSAKNLDIRAFCYVTEGLTLCGVLMFIFVLALQVNGLAVMEGNETTTKGSDLVTVFVTATLLLAFSTIHFFFLHVEVPHMRAQRSDDSVSSFPGSSQSRKSLKSTASSFNLLLGRPTSTSSESCAPAEDGSVADEDEVFTQTFRRFSGRVFSRLSHSQPLHSERKMRLDSERKMRLDVQESGEDGEMKAGQRQPKKTPSSSLADDNGKAAKKRVVFTLAEEN